MPDAPGVGIFAFCLGVPAESATAGQVLGARNEKKTEAERNEGSGSQLRQLDAQVSID